MPVLLFGLSPFLALPTMIAKNYYDNCRIRTPLYGFSVVLWSLALAGWASTPTKFARARLGLIIATAAVVIFSQANLVRFKVVPQVVEQSYIESRLRQYVRETPQVDRPIAIYASEESNRFSGLLVSDEFGMASTARNPDTVVRLLLADLLHKPLVAVQNIPLLLEPVAPPSDAFILDLRDLQIAR